MGACCSGGDGVEIGAILIIQKAVRNFLRRKNRVNNVRSFIQEIAGKHSYTEAATTTTNIHKQTMLETDLENKIFASSEILKTCCRGKDIGTFTDLRFISFSFSEPIRHDWRAFV